MPRLWLVLAGVLLALMGFAATAQAPAPSADEEAMARARRQAENPLRRILEASRITVRRRGAADAPDAPASAAAGPAGVASGERVGNAGEGVTPAPPEPLATPPSGIRITVEPIPPVTTGVAPTPTPADVPTAAPSAAALPALSTAVGQGSGLPWVPEVAAPAPAQAASARVVEDPPVTPPVFKTMEWSPDLPAAPASTPARSQPTSLPAVVADPPGGTEMPSPAPVPTATLPVATPASPVAPLPSAPQLRAMVEPALTDRLRDELGRVDVVTVDLSLAADGTVQDATILTRVPTGVRRVLLSALLQWRYEAMAAPTVHRVELAFER